MIKGVVGDQMSILLDSADKLGIFFHKSANHEEGCFDSMGFEDVEQIDVIDRDTADALVSCLIRQRRMEQGYYDLTLRDDEGNELDNETLIA